MLRLTLLALGASLAIGAAAADEAAAQSGRERAEAARRGEPVRRGDVVIRDGRVYDRDGRVYDRRRSDSDSDSDSDRRYKNGKKNGPKFCQNGQGHPVHGREWCRDKGYDRGYGVYDRVDWDDVYLRRGRYENRRELNRSVLEDILGRTVYGRFDRQRSRLGYNQPLYGRWVDTDTGSVLRLLSGSQPIAQIIDRNRDGRADVVLLYNGR